MNLPVERKNNHQAGLLWSILWLEKELVGSQGRWQRLRMQKQQVEPDDR